MAMHAKTVLQGCFQPNLMQVYAQVVAWGMHQKLRHPLAACALLGRLRQATDQHHVSPVLYKLTHQRQVHLHACSVLQEKLHTQWEQLSVGTACRVHTMMHLLANVLRAL